MGRDPHPFYVPPDARLPGDRVRFPAEEARHLLRVLRFREGDVCRVVDGEGTMLRVRIERTRGGVEGTILSRVRQERSRLLGLGFPVLRQRARTEWMLEKAVEVGADRLVPIAWERGVARDARLPRGRWDRILVEAMKQSQRVWLPRLEEISAAPGPGSAEIGLVLADPEGQESPPEVSGVGEIRLLVVPEGGVTDEERERLAAQGAALWSLGPNRLRAETACVVGLYRLAGALRAAERSSRAGRGERSERSERSERRGGECD